MSFYTSVQRSKNQILYRGYNDTGAAIQDKIYFTPTLYKKVGKDEPKTGWIGGDGVQVTPITTYKNPNNNGKREPIKTMSQMRIAASDLERQYIDVYGNKSYHLQYITKRFPNEIKFNPSFVNVVNFDIEVASDQGFPKPEEALHPIISIALKSSKSSVYEVWGLGDYDYTKTELDMGRDMISYRKFDREEDLLHAFGTYWTNNWPDILTGWNIRFFDIPYLINRIKRLGMDETKLSPFGIINPFDTSRGMKGSQVQHGYEIYGIQQADYLELFKKFGYSYGPQESYKLDQIAYTVLNERKLSYEEHGDLFNLYKNDHQKFIDYNIKDVQLVQRIEDKMGLIELCQTMAYKGGVNISDTFGVTAIWDSIIYRELNKKKIALVPNDTSVIKEKYDGGYVKEPQVGLHDWVVSFDLNSLYPNLIVQYNMSPETLVKQGKEHRNGVEHYMNTAADCDDDVAVAANGSSYRKDFQGIVPLIIESYYAERKEIKQEMLTAERAYQKNKTPEIEKQINRLNNRQMAVKILLNSLYGALGNKWFRYYEHAMAEGITLSGQLAIKWSERCINEELNKIMNTDNFDYVIAIDTDSLYVNFGPLIKKLNPKDPVKFLDKICGGHFQDNLNAAYDELFTHMNAYKNRMVMEREGISDKGIWTAKKRYILNVHNNEGVQYAEPKLKIMGIEAIKSSTPEVVREKFRQVFKVIISGDEKKTQDFISDFYNTFRSLPAESVSFPRGVGFGNSTMQKWINKDTRSKKIYNQGTPIHIRGALLYNDLIDKLNLGKKYAKINDGEKVKFCYLRTPNRMQENVIAFPDFLPNELGLGGYVNYNIQFEKTFIDPLKPVIDATGWYINYDNHGTLDEFFG